MVKIRFSRGINMGYNIIQTAINRTSAQFDNNIKANRFDQLENHYEVTIKCKSSRGKGAKVSPMGRHLTSCCWHVWGTFFDELFKLNPDIVIIAQGNRITKDGGNWIDRDVGRGNMESEMCECAMYVRDMPAGRDAVTITQSRDCLTCKHSMLHNKTGTLCGQSHCLSPLNTKWELFVPNESVDILSETYYDHGGRFYSKPSEALMDTEPLRFKVPEEE